MIVLSALMVIGSAVFGQTTEKQRNHGEGHLKKLRSELALTDEQYASIKTINQKYRDEFSVLRSDSSQERNQKHVTMKKLRDERGKEIDAVLSSEQKVKLEALQKERAEQRKAFMKKRGENRHATMVRELSLSDDQAKRVADANQLFIEKVRTTREKSGASEDLKKARQEHEATIRSILTPEQFDKWKAMRKSMKKKHDGHSRSRKKK